ncbi:hypothetical protein P4O66_003017 [Electrophorus voltai]|uniref:Uncharacterized protein n=1 Tax=Electrophorus voltai TaxID=2609070 RepID=A0AAD8YSU9_9TELE|nr:hypothetical protein P4O66_003017 [Electrophorus voltai]
MAVFSIPPLAPSPGSAKVSSLATRDSTSPSVSIPATSSQQSSYTESGIHPRLSSRVLTPSPPSARYELSIVRIRLENCREGSMSVSSSRVTPPVPVDILQATQYVPVPGVRDTTRPDPGPVPGMGDAARPDYGTVPSMGDAAHPDPVPVPSVGDAVCPDPLPSVTDAACPDPVPVPGIVDAASPVIREHNTSSYVIPKCKGNSTHWQFRRNGHFNNTSVIV